MFNKKKYDKEWTEKNRGKKRTSNIKAKKKLRVLLRKEVLEAYGGKNPKCKCCEEKIVEFLTIDHVNDNGNIERKEKGLKSGYHTYKYLKDNHFPSGYQLLCFNCNQAKHIYGMCPHKK